MAQTSTLAVRPQAATARLNVQRAARTYSFGFAALLTVGMLAANIATEHGGLGLTDQLANVAPLAIAAMASAPSIIGGGFDLSISPLILLTKNTRVPGLLANWRFRLEPEVVDASAPGPATHLAVYEVDRDLATLRANLESAAEVNRAGWPAWFDPTPWTSLDANAIGDRVPAPARAPA